MQHLGSSAERETANFSFGGNKVASSPASSLELLSVRPLTHPKLSEYISKRAVNLSVARKYCSEINYSVCGRHYYAIGFPNDKGGWELRNPFFKGCIAPKAETSFAQGTVRMQLFEGFMDFLSWRTIKPNDISDVVVLNSLALLSKVAPRLGGYQMVESFFGQWWSRTKSIGCSEAILPESYRPICSVPKLQRPQRMAHPPGWNQGKTVFVTGQKARYEKITAIGEASLCFEYLKTYLLPKLGGEIPLVSSTKRTIMEQKNKGGRPSKTLSEKRKYQVLLRLNTMEYYTLLGKAREASISRTEFLLLHL